MRESTNRTRNPRNSPDSGGTTAFSLWGADGCRWDMWIDPFVTMQFTHESDLYAECNGWNVFAAPPMFPCRVQRAQELSGHLLLGRFVAECRRTGFFKLHQCDRSTGKCWCVNQKSGEKINGTQTDAGNPLADCSSYGRYWKRNMFSMSFLLLLCIFNCLKSSPRAMRVFSVRRFFHIK